MKKILLSMITVLSLVAMPLAANAQTNATPLAIPVVGTAAGAVFNGTFALQRFVSRNGALTAVGTLTGTLTDTATGVVTSVVRNVALPVTPGQATCDILHLDLGPLDLNILGLQVDLSRIVLDITAQAGAGNLLGNLLCAVAGLLDNPNALANLLNNILRAL